MDSWKSFNLSDRDGTGSGLGPKNRGPEDLFPPAFLLNTDCAVERMSKILEYLREVRDILFFPFSDLIVYSCVLATIGVRPTEQPAAAVPELKGATRSTDRAGPPDEESVTTALPMNIFL